MIIIGISDRVRDLRTQKPEGKSLEQAKKELEELHEYDIVFEELEKGSLFGPENSMHIKNNELIQALSVISEIKEKQGITERLRSLSYSVSWLKSAILAKDNTIANKAISSILRNEYSSIASIIGELESLKNKIDELEALHITLLKSGLSLDVKTLLEQDFREKHKKLNELYGKQKSVLMGLSSVFASLAKNPVLKGKNK